MKDLKAYDFDLGKIKEHAGELSEMERIRYLINIIIEYKEKTVHQDEELGLEHRMPKELSEGILIKTLENEIEISKEHLAKTKNKIEKATLLFEDGLRKIDKAMVYLKSKPESNDYFIAMLKDRILLLKD